MSVIRGCGTRVRGGVYIEVKLVAGGSPIECFIMDPPIPIEKDTLGLSEVGMKIIYAPDGTPHLLDWVGESYYPNVQDFIEETRKHGVSRRISSRFDLSVLQPASKLMLVHRKAIIRNAADYWLPRLTVKQPDCPRCQVDGCFGHLTPNSEQCRGHQNTPEQWLALEDQVQRVAMARHNKDGWEMPLQTCADLWKDDVEEGTVPGEHADAAVLNDPRRVVRQIGDTTYGARARPKDVGSKYAPGIFMSLPISNVAVINDPDDKAKVDKLFERVQSVLNGLDVYLEDE